jgi:hypothetical protein
MAKYAQNGFRMHLLQSRISKCFRGRTPIPPHLPERGETLAPPHLCLRHSNLPLLYKLRLLLQLFLRTLPLVYV